MYSFSADNYLGSHCTFSIYKDNVSEPPLDKSQPLKPKWDFSADISASHRYNCELQFNIKPLKGYTVICPFSLRSIKKMP